MGLASVNLSAGITWALSKTNSGFTDTTQGTEGAGFSANALDVAVWTELFGAQYTIAAAGTQVVDLRSFTDFLATSVTGTKALAILILVTGAVADKLNVIPNASNGLVWPFHDVTSSIDIPGGGMLMFSEDGAGGKTVDGTHKQLLLTNNGGASLTVKVVALVSTV